MFNEGVFTKRAIHIYLLVWIMIILIVISSFIMIRYFEKGEDNMPFKISKIFIVSSAQTKNLELSEGTYSSDVMQINDIYISVEKNKEFNKEDAIKTISIENFKIIEGGNIGDMEIFREAKKSETSKYKEENKQESIIYTGVQSIDEQKETLEIANQGGVLNFSIVFNNLGNITYLEKENITIDGTLLKRLGMKHEDIKSKVSFDLRIKLESENSFYTKVVLDLPVEDLTESGVSTTELNVSELIFKRGK